MAAAGALERVPSVFCQLTGLIGLFDLVDRAGALRFWRCACVWRSSMRASSAAEVRVTLRSRFAQMICKCIHHVLPGPIYGDLQGESDLVLYRRVRIHDMVRSVRSVCRHLQECWQ